MYIVVAGGGMVGGTLVRRIINSKHDVVVIEQDKQLCENVYAQTGAVVISGSATNISILKEAKIEKADIFVAATGSDADNLAATIMAKSCDVPQLIVRMRDPAYEKAYRLAGADTVLRVTDLLVNQMIIEIDKPDVQEVASISSGKASLFRMIVPPSSRISGKTVKDIVSSRKFPKQCVFAAVYDQKNDTFTIPRGDQPVHEGDELFLISAADDIKAASSFINDTHKKIF